MVTPGLGAVAGKTREEFSFEPITYDEMRPGCYDSVARLEDMDRAGVLASMCFPSFPRFCGQVFNEAEDRELALLCVQAYNDWMIDEWCGRAPGRYIPLTLIPLWNPILAAAEVRRNAARGSTAVAFSENPAMLGLPTIQDPGGHWDPLMAACEETETVLCMHIGSSSKRLTMSDESPMLVTMSWGPPLLIAGAMIEWIFSPVVRKFPGIKVALAEGGIGWMPFFLEKAAQVVEKHQYWIANGDVRHDSLSGRVEVDERAAIDLQGFSVMETFRQHIFGCFIDDVHGVRNLDAIGVRQRHDRNRLSRTAIRPGPTAWSMRKSNWRGSRPRTATRSCVATPSASSVSRRPRITRSRLGGFRAEPRKDRLIVFPSMGGAAADLPR